MKKNISLLTILILSSTVALSTQAQPAPPGSGSSLPDPNGSSFPSSNGPGSSGQNLGGENDARRQAHRQMMLQKFDANHDGQLDDNERAQMHAFMQQRRQQREAQGSSGGFPGNGGPGSFGGPPGGNGQGPQQFRQRMLQKFDANHDGQLDDNEKAQMHEFMQQRRQQREQNGGFGGHPNGAVSGSDAVPPPVAPGSGENN